MNFSAYSAVHLGKALAIMEKIVDLKRHLQEIPEDHGSLPDYCKRFFGYGSWKAPIWFIGMEEGGCSCQGTIGLRLRYWWLRGTKSLENAPEFFRLIGQGCWFCDHAKLQPTWKQLIRIQLVFNRQEANDNAILSFQKEHWGKRERDRRRMSCFVELYPLPPSAKKPRYYDNWCAPIRVKALKRSIRTNSPKAVVFCGMKYLDHWREIVGDTNFQPQNMQGGRIMTCRHNRTSYYVILHPTSHHPVGYFDRVAHHILDHRRPSHLTRMPVR